MPMLRIGFVLVFSLLTCPVHAFQMGFDYAGITEDEATEFDDPSFINSEYQSDYLTYMFHPRDRARFLHADKAFMISVGSLDNKSFMVREELQLRHSFVPRFEFAIKQFKSSDFDEKNSAQVFEFVGWDARGENGVYVFGQPSADKKDDDIGFGYMARPMAGHEHRLYIMFPDFMRNQRNRESDRFTTKPIVNGWRLVIAENANEYTEAAIRHEAPTKWRFADIESQYEYSRGIVSIARRRAIGNQFINWQGEWSKKRETVKPTSASSSVLAVDWRSERLLLFGSYEFSSWEVGGMYADRNWEMNEQKLSAEFYQGFFWYRHLSDPKISRLGFETTTGDLDGEINDVLEDNSTTEWRMNYEWGRRYEKGEVVARFTFDLDEFGSSRTWEGGSVRVGVEF